MMDSNFNPSSEFYCIKLKEYVTAMICKNGLARKGTYACVDSITRRENAAKILDFNKERSKSAKAKKKPKEEKLETNDGKVLDSTAITVKSGGVIKLENAENLKPKMKRCCRCKQYKPLTEFHKNKRTLDGLQWQCKECDKLLYKDKKDKELTGKKKIYLDFTPHDDLFNKVDRLAKENFRPFINQVFYMIKTYIDIDSKYEKAKKTAVAKSLRNLEAEAK